MNMKNRSHRSKTNRPRSKHGYKCSKSKKSLGIKRQFYKMVKTHSCLIVFDHFLGLALKGLSNTEATFESPFIKKLSITEGELKKNVAY